MKSNNHTSITTGYLLVILGSIVFWLSFFSLINQPNPTETIQVFISAKTYDSNLNQQLEGINELTRISSINIICFPKNDNDFEESLLTQGMIESDLLILPESILDYSEQSAFVSLNDQLFQNYQMIDDGLTFKKIGDDQIGILVYDGLTQINYLEGLIDFNENDTSNYYLVINKNSTNAGVYGNTKHSYNDMVFYVLKYLIDQYIQ